MSSAIGQSVHRVDGKEKVTGKAIYTVDLKLSGMLHGKVLRSPFPHARIRHIDSRKAESMTGVLAVLTRENLQVASPFHGFFLKDQPIVALGKVRYAGDIVAAVAATEEGIAEEALKRIEVDYEELPAVYAVEEALQEGAPLVHDERVQRVREPHYGRGASYHVHENSNICHHFRYERGNIEEGFRAADLVLEDTFFFPSAQHYPMEPHGSVANFERDNLTIWSSSQTPFPLRQELSQVFGLPFSRVRVIVPLVGGGYGSKQGIKTEAMAAVLSRMTQRPVKVSFSADESFKTICQPGARIKIKTGLKKDGTFVARRCEVYLNTGAYINTTASVTEKAGYRAHGPYRIPYVLTDAYCVYTNTVPGGSFRGFGGPQAAFAHESHLDMIAHRLKMDALELRMKNLLEKGEEYAPGDTPIDCDLKAGVRQVASAIGWGKESKGLKGSSAKRGKGIALGVKDGGGYIKPAYAMVKILNDGSVLLFSGSVELGQGIYTALLQVVAQELSVPPERVRVAEIDTNFTPYDAATNGSSATVVMGLAVQKAARDAREQLLSAAASVLGTKETEVELKEGGVLSKEKSMSFQELMRLRFGIHGEIVGKGFFSISRKEEAPMGYPCPFWEIGIGAAEVEVDEMTGMVRILKYASLTDAGKMIHPLQCRGQDEGAVLFGIGQALSEELVYEEGQLINSNLVDYHIPRFRDVPEAFSSQIREEGGGSGPYGAKGIGEGGVLAVAPAVSNALYDATGVRMQRVPLKGERVWQAIEKQRSGQGKG